MMQLKKNMDLNKEKRRREDGFQDQEKRNKILILDGYIDEPGCLGVPPYLAPQVRYLYGALKLKFNESIEIEYKTIDQLRNEDRDEEESNRNNQEKNGNQENKKNEKYKRYNNKKDQYLAIIIVSGVAVPGKYLGGKPLKFADLYNIQKKFYNSLRIFTGPAAENGIGEEGGKPPIPSKKIKKYVHYIVKGDSFIEIPEIIIKFQNKLQVEEKETKFYNCITKDLKDLREVAISGADLVRKHPNHLLSDGGNLICEIETFRGCPRFNSGGCAFCVEPLKGKPLHRPINDIIDEIKALYDKGCRAFRLGSQTDFYAFQHQGYENKRYPRPDPNKIKELLKRIREKCPDIKVLHIDNVNALNFVLYPNEAELITKYIVKYCTPGNVAAIGVESVDPVVIKKNNLKVNEEELWIALKIINKWGAKRGDNGQPYFLPGLNFINGLPGETANTLELNKKFLEKIIQKNILVRRINIRKFLPPNFIFKNQSEKRKWTKHMNKFASKHYIWKNWVRNQIDHTLLKKIFPIGTEIKGLYAELQQGQYTYFRPVGTYPILCVAPQKKRLHYYYDGIVIGHGERSISILIMPIKITELSLNQLTSIDGIGKRRAKSIKTKQPKTIEQWLDIVPKEVYKNLCLFDSDLPKL